jgi:hypothetical protein
MTRRPDVEPVNGRVPIAFVAKVLNIHTPDVVARIVITATRFTEKAVVKRLIYVHLESKQHQKPADQTIGLLKADDVVAKNGEVSEVMPKRALERNSQHSVGTVDQASKKERLQREGISISHRRHHVQLHCFTAWKGGDWRPSPHKPIHNLARKDFGQQCNGHGIGS